MSRPAPRPPRRFCRIIDAATDRDREYLEQHPDEPAYVRDYVPGECWPKVLPQATAILVQRLLPGRSDARRRIAITDHSVEDVRAVLADPVVTLFVPSLDGKSWEALR
jgi:hypothetical protein